MAGEFLSHAPDGEVEFTSNLEYLQPGQNLYDQAPFSYVIGKVLPQLVSLSDIPVGAYANAFTPIPQLWDFHGDASIPPSRTDITPQAYADHAANWLTAGARIIGGCCEVGPAHIAKLNKRFKQQTTLQD